MISRKYFLLRTSVIATRWDQIRWQLMSMLSTIFIFNKSKKTTSQSRQSHIGTSWNVSATCCVGPSQLDTSWYIATTSQIGRVFYIPVRHHKNVSDRFVLLTYKLRRRDEVSALSRTLKLVSKIGEFLLSTKAIHFSGTSGGSASLKYQLVGRYISKMSVSFRYSLRPLCNALNWCHLGINWYITTTSPIGLFYLRTNETSQIRHKLVCLIHVPVATSW